MKSTVYFIFQMTSVALETTLDKLECFTDVLHQSATLFTNGMLTLEP